MVKGSTVKKKRKKEAEKLVIDGNALYELDTECLERKRKGNSLQSTRNIPIIEQAKNNKIRKRRRYDKSNK